MNSHYFKLECLQILYFRQTQVRESTILTPTNQEEVVVDDTPITEEEPLDIGHTKPDLSTYEALFTSTVFIFVSEIGDKTFMYLLLSAAKLNTLKLIAVGTFGLGLMHCLGTFVGGILHNLISLYWLQLASIVLFLFIGAFFIFEGLRGEEDDDNYVKLESVQTEMIDANERLISSDDTETGEANKANKDNASFFERVRVWMRDYPYIAIFLTIFATEMGDMSQVAAVVLAAQYGFFIVALGG